MQKSERPGWVPDSGLTTKSDLYTFTIGICATGRPPTLQPLLASVLSSDFPGFAMTKVVLVASAVDEESLRMARRFAAREPRMLLIEHEERTGKADAINEVFRETEGDFLVYVNADAMVTPDAILALL